MGGGGGGGHSVRGRREGQAELIGSGIEDGKERKEWRDTKHGFFLQQHTVQTGWIEGS